MNLDLWKWRPYDVFRFSQASAEKERGQRRVCEWSRRYIKQWSSARGWQIGWETGNGLRPRELITPIPPWCPYLDSSRWRVQAGKTDRHMHTLQNTGPELLAYSSLRQHCCIQAALYTGCVENLAALWCIIQCQHGTGLAHDSKHESMNDGILLSRLNIRSGASGTGLWTRPTAWWKSPTGTL